MRYARGLQVLFRSSLFIALFAFTAPSGYSFDVSLMPKKSMGGQGFLLTITGPATGYYEIQYNGKDYKPFGSGARKNIFLPVKIEDKGKKQITVKYSVQGSTEQVKQLWLKVSARSKKSVRLKTKDVQMRAEEPIIAEQNRVVLEKLRTRSEDKLWADAFTAPLKAKISEKFAMQRKASTYQYYHKGIDYSAPVGAKVCAPNDGVVIYAKGGLNVYGNLMMIDHGQGVVSCYFHLNKFLKKEGEKVSKGEVIAEVGKTGWATGPHLHFGIYIQGEAVDPLWWVKFTKSKKVSGKKK